MNHDFLRRFLFENFPIRGEYVRLEQSFQTIMHQHRYPEPIRRLLGEALCIAALLSAIIKFDGRLTVQFRGKGQLKLLLAQCDHQFRLRGLAKWDESTLSYEALLTSFEQGILVIMLDQGSNKNRYQGIVAWRGNSLAESIEGYFRESEQLTTKIWLAVNDTNAVGYLLQAIPATDKEQVSLENELVQAQWQTIMLESKIKTEDLLELTEDTLLLKLYPQDEIRIFEPMPVVFHCTCSRQRSADAIALMGKQEAEEELQTHHVIVVTCDFCNKEYIFDRADIEKIFAQEDPPPNTHLH